MIAARTKAFDWNNEKKQNAQLPNTVRVNFKTNLLETPRDLKLHV